MGAEKCQKRVLVVEDNELNRKIAESQGPALAA